MCDWSRGGEQPLHLSVAPPLAQITKLMSLLILSEHKSQAKQVMQRRMGFLYPYSVPVAVPVPAIITEIRVLHALVTRNQVPGKLAKSQVCETAATCKPVLLAAAVSPLRKENISISMILSGTGTPRSRSQRPVNADHGSGSCLLMLSRLSSLSSSSPSRFLVPGCSGEGTSNLNSFRSHMHELSYLLLP